MDETLGFFNELLRMMSVMVNDIMPDMLLHLDQRTLETLMNESQVASNSLQVFTKLCGIISRKNLSSSVVTPELEGPRGEVMSVESVQPSQPPQVSSANDDNSTVSNFSDLFTHSDDVWKGLLTEAQIWCIRTHKKEPLPLYYCGICNKQAKAKHIWEAHIGGKNHVKLVANVDAVKLVCGTCGLCVYGTMELVNNINSSKEHKQYDLLFCSSRPASPVDSVTLGPSCKVTSKKQGPELSDTSEASKPSVSGQSSTKDNASSVSQNPEPAAQKLSPKVSNVLFQKTEIHNNFVNVTEIISGYIENHEPFEIAYCRPCEIICESKRQWNVHKKTPKHRSKMSLKHFNNVLCRCLQCEFVVTAGLKIATTYMKYHIEYCHHQSTEGIKIEEYMELKNLALDVKTPKNVPKSKASSFKGSSETIYSVRSSATDVRSSRADLRIPSPDPCLASDDLRFHLNKMYSGSRIPSPVGDRDVGQYAEQSNSTASSSRSTGVTKTTSANPYKSSTTSSSCVLNPWSSRDDLCIPSPHPGLASDDPLFPLNVEIHSGARTPSPVGDRDVGQYAGHSTSTASSSRSAAVTKTTSANPYKSCTTKPPTDQVSDLDPSAQNTHSTQNDAPSALSDADLEFTFLQMLYKKEKSFQKDTTFKLFTALCIVCKRANFSSRNVWNHHVHTHTKSDSFTGKEISCTQCDSHFFGQVGDIAPFMNHDYHVCIDAMFSW